MFNCLIKDAILVCLKYCARTLLNSSPGNKQNESFLGGNHHIKWLNDWSLSISYSLCIKTVCVLLLLDDSPVEPGLIPLKEVVSEFLSDGAVLTLTIR